MRLSQAFAHGFSVGTPCAIFKKSLRTCTPAPGFSHRFVQPFVCGEPVRHQDPAAAFEKLAWHAARPCFIQNISDRVFACHNPKPPFDASSIEHTSTSSRLRSKDLQRDNGWRFLHTAVLVAHQ